MLLITVVLCSPAGLLVVPLEIIRQTSHFLQKVAGGIWAPDCLLFRERVFNQLDAFFRFFRGFGFIFFARWLCQPTAAAYRVCRSNRKYRRCSRTTLLPIRG